MRFNTRYRLVKNARSRIAHIYYEAEKNSLTQGEIQEKLKPVFAAFNATKIPQYEKTALQAYRWAFWDMLHRHNGPLVCGFEYKDRLYLLGTNYDDARHYSHHFSYAEKAPNPMPKDYGELSGTYWGHSEKLYYKATP